MRYGKLNTTELEQYVLCKLRTSRKEVVLSAAEGEDCAALRPDGATVLLSSDPITADMSPRSLGELAVQINCNDIAANGGEPVAVMLTVIVPPSYPPENIGVIVSSAVRAAEVIGVDVVGGHTEFSDCVTRAVVSATVAGFCNRLLTKDGVKKGDRLGVTKRLGMEGVAILLEAMGKADAPLYATYKSRLSVVPESRVLVALPTVSMMHDVTEGGILGAVAEVVASRGLGAQIFADKLPIDGEALLVCEQAGVDILRLLSSGAMLFATTDMPAALQALRRAGIEGCEIGAVTDGRTDLITADGAQPVTVQRDALYDYIGVIGERRDGHSAGKR